MEDHGLLDAMTEQFGGANKEQNAPFNPLDATSVDVVPVETMPTEANQTEAPHTAADDKTHVVVKDPAGNRMEFILKRNVPMGRLMTYYTEATGHDQGFYRFHLDDGERILNTDTPESVSMNLCVR